MKDELGEIVADIVSEYDEEEAVENLINQDTPKEDNEDGDQQSPSRPSVDLDADDPRMDVDPLPTKVMHCKTCGNQMNPITEIQGECPKCALKRLRTIEASLVKLKQLNPEFKFCTIDAHGLAYKNPIQPDYNKVTVLGVDFYPPGDICAQCMTNLRAYFTRFLEDRGITRKGQGHEKNPFAETTLKLPIQQQLDAHRRFEKFMLSVQAYANDKESGIANTTKFYMDRQKLLLKKEAKKKWEENEKRMNLLYNSSPILQQANPLQNQKEAEKLKDPEVLKSAVKKKGLEFLKKTVLTRLFLTEDENKVPRPILMNYIIAGAMSKLPSVHWLPLLAQAPTMTENEKEALYLVNALRQEISSLMGQPYAAYVDECTEHVVKTYNDWISELASEHDS